MPFPAPLSEQLYTNVTTMIMPNSTVVFTGLVGSNDSAALGWALRVNVTGQRESAFGTPSIDSVFWQAAIVTDAFAANVTAAIRPAPPSPPAEGATPPPPEPTTGLRYPWTTAEPLDDDAAGNFTAWILPPSTFLREVRPPDVALPYWIAARAPALPGELCAGGFLPGDPTPLPSAPTPSAGGSPRTGGAAAPPRRGPISDRATMGVVHGLWALLGVVGVVTIVATWANTARLGRLQLEETTFVPPGDGRGGGGRGGGDGRGGGGGGGGRRGGCGGDHVPVGGGEGAEVRVPPEQHRHSVRGAAGGRGGGAAGWQPRGCGGSAAGAKGALLLLRVVRKPRHGDLGEEVDDAALGGGARRLGLRARRDVVADVKLVFRLLVQLVLVELGKLGCKRRPVLRRRAGPHVHAAGASAKRRQHRPPGVLRECRDRLAGAREGALQLVRRLPQHQHPVVRVRRGSQDKVTVKGKGGRRELHPVDAVVKGARRGQLQRGGGRGERRGRGRGRRRRPPRRRRRGRRIRRRDCRGAKRRWRRRHRQRDGRRGGRSRRGSRRR